MDQTVNLVEELLKYENLPYDTITDLRTLMTVTRGQLNPINAVGYRVKGYSDILTNIYQAVEFVNEKGLRQCS